MFKAIVITWLILAVAIAVAAAIVPSVEIDGGILGLLGVALIFGLVNALVGTLVRRLALPLTLLTFGLLAFVINAAMLALTAGLSSNLDVGGFWAALFGSILISVVTAVLSVLLLRPVTDAVPGS